MKCFICKENRLHRFLSLGNQPPSDAFLRKEELEKPEAAYPLELSFCNVCKLVQLGYVVDPELLFREYVYTTGMNNSLRENFRQLVERLVLEFALTGTDLAVDIGSNDGTLLSNYAAHGVPVLGVEPSSAGDIAIAAGVRTVRDFFNEETAKRIAVKYGKARMLTATNVFAHVADLDSFMRGIALLLPEDGVFVSESGYLLDMIETLGYDAVYHEHLRYYSLRPLMALFEQHGMEVFHVERIPSHNGSIRVFTAKTGAYPKRASVAGLLAEEAAKKLYELGTFEAFALRVAEHKEALVKLLAEAKAVGGRIVGIGAPAKGNTLLNFCRLGTDTVSCLLEKSELKIGLFAPGTHIPVVDEGMLFKEQPEYALLLSWNIAAELMSKLRAKGYRGKFIVPFPWPKIADL